tara:strand:- start:1283 stop:1660 length:378 start_codon:yes stop_codon:yes gene_type:complete
MQTLKDNNSYDQVVPLAKNGNGDIISACKYGKMWFYVYESKNEDCGRIGYAFDSKYLILERSREYILNQCGYNFNSDDLLLIGDKQMVFLTEDQQVSINTAIRLLNDSNSDHADQCLYHLKTIVK